jgi:hypothetical protein
VENCQTISQVVIAMVALLLLIWDIFSFRSDVGSYWSQPNPYAAYYGHAGSAARPQW